jgi:hypothetical protein
MTYPLSFYYLFPLFIPFLLYFFFLLILGVFALSFFNSLVFLFVCLFYLILFVVTDLLILVMILCILIVLVVPFIIVLFYGVHCGITLPHANHHLLISVFAFLVTVTIIAIHFGCIILFLITSIV